MKKKKKTHKQINICIVEFGLLSGGVKTKSVAIQEMPCVLNEMKKPMANTQNNKRDDLNPQFSIATAFIPVSQVPHYSYRVKNDPQQSK